MNNGKKEVVISAVNRLMQCASHDSCENVDCIYFNSAKDLELIKEYIERSDINEEAITQN